MLEINSFSDYEDKYKMWNLYSQLVFKNENQLAFFMFGHVVSKYKVSNLRQENI